MCCLHVVARQVHVGLSSLTLEVPQRSGETLCSIALHRHHSPSKSLLTGAEVYRWRCVSQSHVCTLGNVAIRIQSARTKQPPFRMRRGAASLAAVREILGSTTSLSDGGWERSFSLARDRPRLDSTLRSIASAVDDVAQRSISALGKGMLRAFIETEAAKNERIEF